MRISVLVVSGIITSSLVCFAARPIANVTSSEPYKVSGVAVPVAGVKSWPVVAGDELRAGEAPLVVTFKDGSRVTLGKNSRAKVEGEGRNAALRLFDGAMGFLLLKGSKVRLYSESNPVSAQAGVAGTAVAGSARQADAAGLTGARYGAGVAADCCTTPPVISRRR